MNKFYKEGERIIKKLSKSKEKDNKYDWIYSILYEFENV